MEFYDEHLGKAHNHLHIYLLKGFHDGLGWEKKPSTNSQSNIYSQKSVNIVLKLVKWLQMSVNISPLTRAFFPFQWNLHSVAHK